MTETETKALKAKEKAEVTSQAEQTTPGVVFNPAVDIFEREQDLTILADMPGVKAKDLTIDLRENILTLLGNVESPEGQDETEVLKEYRIGKFYRQFNLSEVIDQAKIEAELKDGVLTLKLPKVEKAAARKIEVKAV